MGKSSVDSPPERSRFWWLALTGLLSACAWGEGAGPEAPGLEVSKGPQSGDEQTGTVSAELASPFRVMVTSAGAPVAGVTVAWAASGGASVAPVQSVTDDDGIASTTLTLGPASGTQTATASVADAQGSPVEFTATAVDGPLMLVARTTSSSGDGQTGTTGETLANPLRVIVTLDGVAQTGVTVTWTALDEGASLEPGSSVSGAAGIATSTWTLGGVTGTQRAMASVGGAAGSPVYFQATAVAPAAGDTVLVINNQYSPKNLTVPAGTTVAWVWPANSRRHNIIPVAPATVPNSSAIVDGPFSYSYTFNTPGTYSYYCSVHGTAGGGGMFGTVVVQ